MLRVEHLKIGGLPPLSFEVGDGECLAIEGPSGVGKTRLLRAIADLDAAPGLVFLDGAERHEFTAPEWRKAVRYAAAEPGWWGGTPRATFPAAAASSQRLAKFAGALGLDAQILDRPLVEISTGERQRLALARTLFDEPHVLLLDEPTASLDPVNAALVEELVKYQMLSGRKVVIVTHNSAQIERLADARLQLAKPAANQQAETARA